MKQVFSMSEFVGREVKDVKATYIGFVMRRLEEIWRAWDEDKPEVALSQAVRYVLFAPTTMKKDIIGEANRIIKEINQAYDVKAGDFYSTQLAQNKRARQVALKHLPGFIDKLVQLMDKRGYLERTKEFRSGKFQRRA